MAVQEFEKAACWEEWSIDDPEEANPIQGMVVQTVAVPNPPEKRWLLFQQRDVDIVEIAWTDGACPKNKSQKNKYHLFLC